MMIENQDHLPLLSLRDALAAVPGLVGRTVSVRASLAISTLATVRVEPRAGETSLGDLPRRAHEAYGAWVDGLRRLGVVLVGAETRLDVEPAGPDARPVLAAADVDRVRADLVQAIGLDGTGPHDLLIHARRQAAGWSLYGLDDLSADRRERVANLLDEHVRRGARWLQRSPDCALLIPDLAVPRTLATSDVARASSGRHPNAETGNPLV
jgi:hypothetical protein